MLPPARTISRAIFGAALCLAGAALLTLALAGTGKHGHVLTLIVLAMGVAIARPFAGRWRWGDTAVNLALGTLTGAAVVYGEGPWVPALGGAAVAMALLGTVFHWLGNRLGLSLLGGVVILGVSLGSWGLCTAPMPDKPGELLHTWNQFHYVLGSKYFDEVGYHDLYSGILLADEESERHFAKVKKVRNMRTYEYWNRREASKLIREAGFRERFDDARWAEFQRDIGVFHAFLGEGARKGVFTDLGFNPSPAWLVLHRPLTNAVELHEGRTLVAFAALQVPLYVLTLVALLWAFGLRRTLWVALWTLLFWGNSGRLLGGYFSYDWFMLSMVALALIARARDRWAAPLLAYAGLMRGFPGLLALGHAVHFAWDAARLRRPRPRTTRFLVVLAVAIGVVLAGSSTTDAGPKAWLGWHEKISFHSYRISAGSIHLGLKTLFGEDYSEPGIVEDLDQRRAIQERNKPWFYTAAGLLSLWTLLVMRRRGTLDASILGLVPASMFMVLSRYYYATWVAFLLLGHRPERKHGNVAVQLCMFGLLSLFHAHKLWGEPNHHVRYHLLNVTLLALWVLMLGSYTVLDWKQRRVPPTAEASTGVPAPTAYTSPRS